MPTPWDYTTTPPGDINYNTADAPTGTAPSHSNPAAMTNVAPGHADPTALTNIAPNSSNPAALTGAAPGHADPAVLTNAAPNSSNPAALTATAPGHTNPAALTNTPPQVLNPDGTTQTGLPTMPAAFTPAFIELTGGGSSLNTLTANAADATAGKVLQGTVGGQLKSYQVRDGTDAQDLPGIVHPANHDPVLNPVVFVQL